jgi:hypothetical protein
MTTYWYNVQNEINKFKKEISKPNPPKDRKYKQG